MQRIRNARTQYCVKRAISFFTGTQVTILTKKKLGLYIFFTLYLTNLTQPIFDTRKAIFCNLCPCIYSVH